MFQRYDESSLQRQVTLSLLWRVFSRGGRYAVHPEAAYARQHTKREKFPQQKGEQDSCLKAAMDRWHVIGGKDQPMGETDLIDTGMRKERQPHQELVHLPSN
ncbi:hypothetical protein O3P69_014237 [Scylla paramamosain]|uniref:Uncharacterized protein n=1 Tax=Scylla paramamosain TaxID=85552 RepID=A0AAW0TAZ5_SCYPA